MDDGLSVDDMKATFQRVAHYRAVNRAVRAGAGGTLFNGVFWLGITYMVRKFIPPFLLQVDIALGAVEIGIGLLKRFRPSLLCVLLDGLMLFVFGGVFGYFHYDQFQRFGRIDPFVLFALWWVWQGFQTIRRYFALKAQLGPAPSYAQLRYVDDLIDDILAGDPETDQTALRLAMPLAGKLLGDVGLFAYERGGDVIAAAREDVSLTRTPDGLGLLRVEGNRFPPAPLSAANWQNYARWQTEGGRPPRDA